MCGTRQAGVILEIFGLPDGAWVIAVGLHREISEGQEIDTIPLFEGFDIGIPDRDAQDGSYQGHITCHGSHPFDVMVSPLDIVVTNGGEHVQYLGGSGTTIEDISYDMKRVNGERMNEITDGNNELVGTTGLDDGVNDGVVIGLPVTFV